MREIRSSGSVEGVMGNHDSYSDFIWFVSAGCGTCLPGGCAVATASQGDWKGSGEGEHSYVWGKESRTSKRREQRITERRACVRRAVVF